MKKTSNRIAVLFIALAMVSGYLYFQEKNKATYKEAIIASSSESFKSDLKSFLIDVESSVEKLRTDISLISVDKTHVDLLNEYFSKLTAFHNSVYFSRVPE